MYKNTVIELYEPCPCGSGEKYKFCCKPKGEIQCAEDISRLTKISEGFSEEKKSYMKEISEKKVMPLFDAIEYVDEIDVMTLEEFFADEHQNNDEDEETCKPEDCNECEYRDGCDFDFEKAAEENYRVQTLEEAKELLNKLISKGEVIERNGKYLFLPFKF